MPTETALTCSRNPTTRRSPGEDTGIRRAASALNDETYRVGISSWETAARSTSRMASVEITRVMPSRAASCVATVDLPTPVAPPRRMMSG